MKKLLTLALALGLTVQSMPVNANFTSVFSTETSGENTEGTVKYQLNENEYFYYADDSLDLSNIESFNTSLLYGVTFYQKTVKVNSEEQYFYDTLDYKEYKNGIWYEGTLNLGDIVKTSNGWRATYTGYLYATGK